MFQGMHPRVRDCDPRAYFRAKLASLRAAHKTLLTDDEYAAQREEVFQTIVGPNPVPRLMLAILLVTMIGGIAATTYGVSTGNWVFVAGGVPPG